MERRLTQLGELQVSILQVLWRLGKATVSEVRAALPDHPKPAYTTVLTVLRSLERRGLAAHNTLPGHRQYHYHPLVSQEEVRQAALVEVLDRHFSGDVDGLISALVSQGLLSPESARQTRELGDGVYRP